jgi:ribose transport system permease protein
MAALANGMTLWGVETLTQQLIKGFIFLIVIALTFERKSVEVIK